jgi:hypothetical protein
MVAVRMLGAPGVKVTEIVQWDFAASPVSINSQSA